MKNSINQNPTLSTSSLTKKHIFKKYKQNHLPVVSHFYDKALENIAVVLPVLKIVPIANHLLNIQMIPRKPNKIQQKED